MNGAPSFAQVRAQVAAVREKVPDARVIGIRVPELGWDSPTLRVGNEELPVACCGSVLEMRARLVEHPCDGPPLVVLTNVPAAALGADLLARFAKRQLFSIEPWQLVKERFRARYVDPRLVERHRWVALALLEAEPDEGYLPAPSGFLEAETAWRHLFEVLAGLPKGERDPEALLAWALDAKPTERLAPLTDEVRAGLAKAVHETAGPVAGAVFASAGRLGLRAFSVGLVASVLFDPEVKGDERAAKARGKLEALLGLGDLAGELARSWAEAAERIVGRRLASAADPQRALAPLLADADALLRELGAEDLAWRSGVLRTGLDQRLERLARELVQFAEGSETALPSSVRSAAERVLDHELTAHDPSRAAGVEMALRLAGWLGTRRGNGAAKAGSFPDAALRYRAEGGFADWARTRVWDGDLSSQALSEAYALLAQKADLLRQEENRQFGTLLAGWLSSGSDADRVLGVETVLDRVVAPLAKAHPVLLVVIDAMSVSVFRELERDLARRGWVELLGEGDSARPAVIAALPTVTEVSRASLLCGEITTGNAPREKEGFAKHPGLLSVSEPTAPPVLFHKGDLREAGAAGVAPKVLEVIANLHQRVVGVVINAVDDHLAKGDQVRVPWTAHHIRPLEELLEVSRASGRVIVLVSDHGHILERETESREGEGSERWRPAAGPPADDELLLEGPRVGAEGKRLLAPWSERVRFGMKKNGYHGGATPQEVVIPLGVFATADTAARVEGWQEATPETPPWWTWRRAAAAPEPEKAKAPKAPSRPLRKGETGDLFAQPEPVTEPAWIDRLFETDLFGAQRKQAARTSLPEERIRTILHALDERGGKLTAPALAERLGVPAFRLGGIVSAMRRILNVDGYDVLSVDDASETISLNRDLLEAQFGLTGRK